MTIAKVTQVCTPSTSIHIMSVFVACRPVEKIWIFLFSTLECVGCQMTDNDDLSDQIMGIVQSSMQDTQFKQFPGVLITRMGHALVKYLKGQE